MRFCTNVMMICQRDIWIGGNNRDIFSKDRIEIGFGDRYRDTYHSNFITMYSKTIPLIGLFLILQIGLRIIMDYSISLYIQRKIHPANMAYLESSTS